MKSRFLVAYPFFLTTKAIYKELFEAVWSGDIEKVNKLTIEQPFGKQVHICCSSSFTQRTPLHIAMEKGNAKMVIRLIEIAMEQFTPLKTKDKKKDDKVPLINNYELTRIMGQLTVRLFVVKKLKKILAWSLLQSNYNESWRFH